MDLPSPLVDDPKVQMNFDSFRRSLTVLELFHFGAGSPENVVAAPIGHVYLRSDGGAGTTFWVKEADDGDPTGWDSK